ncbi:MAG: hypothetical protein ACLTDR_07340 [Adlercreutzia equolifaciens]
MTHYGLVDATGAMVVDLTDLVHGYGYTFQGNLQDASVTNSPTYADGRLVLFIEWSGGSYVSRRRPGRAGGSWAVCLPSATQRPLSGSPPTRARAGREFTCNLTTMNAP